MKKGMARSVNESTPTNILVTKVFSGKLSLERIVVKAAIRRDYSYRLGASYHGPWGVVLAGSYTHQAGPWSGAIFSRLDAPDPTFGSAQVTLPDGSTQGNPLATAIRFRFPTRNENQVKLGDTKRISIKVGKQFELGDARRVDVAFNFFNIPNFGDFQQYTYNGGNSDFNQSFLQPRNRQPGRGVQFDITLHY